jgi:hypothetical protein
MKILINESDLRNLLVNRLGIDLTGKVKILTSVYHIPMVFDEYMNSHLTRVWMNNYGPMYLIKLPDETLIYQKQGKIRDKILVNSEGESYQEQEVLDKLGVPPIGLTLTDIVNTFGEEMDMGL